MLDNISGPDAIASTALIEDLKALCSLPKEELSTLAKTFATLSGVLTEADGIKLMSALKPLRVDPEMLQPGLNAAKYVWETWASAGLSKDQVLADFRSLGLSDEQLQNVIPLINAMEGKLGTIRRRQGEKLALGIGTPLITNCAFVVDARTIFKNRKFHEDAGDSQPYYEVDFLLPIVILEIMSELNNKKDTASFVLEERELDDMINILSRAKKRLKIVKNQIARLAISEQQMP